MLLHCVVFKTTRSAAVQGLTLLLMDISLVKCSLQFKLHSMRGGGGPGTFGPARVRSATTPTSSTSSAVLAFMALTTSLYKSLHFFFESASPLVNGAGVFLCMRSVHCCA